MTVHQNHVFYRRLSHLLSNGDLVVITGRVGPSATDKFPFLAYVEIKYGQIFGRLPGASFPISFVLSTDNPNDGYKWRLPGMQDASLFEETKLVP